MSNGKGDTPRPLSVDQQTFANNWDRIFGNTSSQTAVAAALQADEPLIELQSEYAAQLASGLFFEWYPELTGNWEEDKLRWSLRQHRLIPRS